MIRVIVADNADIIREYVQMSLNDDPEITVVGVAASGAEAVALAQETAFDIALLDVDMETPIAGIMAAGQILSQKPDAKIIFLTMHDEDETILSAMEAGGVDYVIKSDDLSETLEHIKNAYSGAVRMQPSVNNVITKAFLRLRKNQYNLLNFVRDLSALTPAEKDLIRLLLAGKSISKIARERVVEISTVKSQIGHLLKKLQARRTQEIVDRIREMGLTYMFQ